MPVALYNEKPQAFDEVLGAIAAEFANLIGRKPDRQDTMMDTLFQF